MPEPTYKDDPLIERALPSPAGGRGAGVRVVS